MRVAFLGLGLIGGSVAYAVRHDPAWSLVAWTPDGNGPRRALEAGVIDECASTPATAVQGAGLVVLAAPPVSCLGLLRELAGPLRPALLPDVVITDVASTKAALVAVADELALPFVGGHPMAGREQAGFAAADGDLLRDRPWVIVPGAHAGDGAVALVERLARACGGHPVRMDAAEHDAALAGISHVPLVVAAALVEAVAGLEPPRPGWEAARGLAAGGWASMTRLARGDATMGAGIAVTNAAAIAAGLRDVEAALAAWRALLETPGGPPEAEVRRRLAAARARLEAGVRPDG